MVVVPMGACGILSNPQTAGKVPCGATKSACSKSPREHGLCPASNILSAWGSCPLGLTSSYVGRARKLSGLFVRLQAGAGSTTYLLLHGSQPVSPCSE